MQKVLHPFIFVLTASIMSWISWLMQTTLTIQKAANDIGEYVSPKAATAIATALGFIENAGEGNEKWRPVGEFPGNYEVSNLGRVRSVDRIERSGEIARGRVGRILTPHPLKPPRLPYLRVGLCADGKQVSRAVHRLVALAFLGDPPEPDYHVAHIDGKPQNNVVENLMWATAAENLSHQIAHGTRRTGEACSNSILTEDDVRKIRSMVKPNFRARKIANELGFTTAQVHAVITGNSWRHVK